MKQAVVTTDMLRALSTCSLGFTCCFSDCATAARDQLPTQTTKPANREALRSVHNRNLLLSAMREQGRVGHELGTSHGSSLPCFGNATAGARHPRRSGRRFGMER